MRILNNKNFMKKYNLKNDTMNESELKKNYKFKIYPRDFKIYSDEGLVNIDDGSQGETQWVYFIVKESKSFYFHNFGGAPDNFLLNQLPEPIL